MFRMGDALSSLSPWDFSFMILLYEIGRKKALHDHRERTARHLQVKDLHWQSGRPFIPSFICVRNVAKRFPLL